MTKPKRNSRARSSGKHRARKARGVSKKLLAKLAKTAEGRIDAMAQAILESDLADSRAAYLQRGRNFGKLEDGEVQRQWAAAFRLWAAKITPQRQLIMDDLMAELGLRGLQPNKTLVQAELEALVAELKSAYDEDPQPPEVMRKIEEYMRRSRDDAN